MPVNAFGQAIGDPIADWSVRCAPPRTPIAGRLCRLEPLALRHADPLFAAFAEAEDGRDWTYLSVERFDDPAAWRTFVETEAEANDPLHHVILDQATGAPLGKLALMRIDRANGVIEIGHVAFSPRLKRTPMATEAVFLLMRRAFDELGYRRLEWKCDSHNAPSRRTAERLGFAFEGVFRNAIVTKGRNRDTAWYAITDTDWPAIRASLVAWLAPDNFTADGRQRQGLASIRAHLPFDLA